MERLFSYIKGYLKIRIFGNSIERFMNICTSKKMYLWNIVRKNNTYEMYMYIKDFKKIKPVLRKTNTKVKIVERHGFPFFIQKYKFRYCFWIGIALCSILFLIYTLFIWEVTITGNYTYTDENIYDFLETIHIEKGMRISEVDCARINSSLREHYDEITWVSSSISGTKLNIQIKESEEKLNSTDEIEMETEVPYDVISDINCTITSVIVRNGRSNISVGDVVEKGQVLISGQIPIYNDSKEITGYQYCISDAEIRGQYTIQYQDVMDFDTTLKNYYDVQKIRYFLELNQWRLTFGDISDTYEYSDTYLKQYSRFKITYGKEIRRPYELIAKNYSKTELQQILSQNYQYYCDNLEKMGVVIIQNDVKIYTWSQQAKAIGTLTVEQPVGQLIKSEQIEIGESIDGNAGNNN